VDDIVRKALEFYAEPDNWKRVWGGPYPGTKKVEFDEGQKAIEALAALDAQPNKQPVRLYDFDDLENERKAYKQGWDDRGERDEPTRE
jgi:hypothetical protein